MGEIAASGMTELLTVRVPDGRTAGTSLPYRGRAGDEKTDSALSIRRQRRLLVRMTRFAVAAVAGAFMASPAGASAAATGALSGHTMNGRPIPCVAQSDGVRVCYGD